MGVLTEERIIALGFNCNFHTILNPHLRGTHESMATARPASLVPMCVWGGSNTINSQSVEAVRSLHPPPSPLAPCMMLLGFPLQPKSMQGRRSAFPSTWGEKRSKRAASLT